MLGVVVNPNARASRRDPQLAARLGRQVGARGRVWTTGDAAMMAEVAEALVAADCRTLAVVGGDGTTQVTVTAVERAYAAANRPLPRYVFLRGGTVNTVANNFGGRGSPEARLARLLALFDAGPLPTRRSETLRCNGLVGFLFGAAMGGRFLEAYYEDGQPDVWRSVTLTARTLASCFVWGPLARRLFAETPARIVLDGAPQAVTRPRLLVASTVPDMGVGFRVTWQAASTPGRFHVIASEMSPLQLARQVHRVWLAQPLVPTPPGQPHLDALCARADLTFAAPEPYTLDGELFRSAEVTLGLGPTLDIAII